MGRKKAETRPLVENLAPGNIWNSRTGKTFPYLAPAAPRVFFCWRCLFLFYFFFFQAARWGSCSGCPRGEEENLIKQNLKRFSTGDFPLHSPFIFGAVLSLDYLHSHSDPQGAMNARYHRRWSNVAWEDHASSFAWSNNISIAICLALFVIVLSGFVRRLCPMGAFCGPLPTETMPVKNRRLGYGVRHTPSANLGVNVATLKSWVI